MLPPPGPHRAALITGASSGIGAEIARSLSGRGHHVVLVARRTDQLSALADDLPGPSSVLGADLSQPSERSALPDRVAALGLEIDILVNNAGLTTMGPVAAADPGAECTVVEVDVTAVVDLCTRFVAGMVSRRRGAVLNVASVAAFGPLPGQAVYGAAKAFVLSYTRAVGEELKASGVTATALCPGPVHTGFGEAAGFTTEEAEAALPKPLWVSPREVAEAAVDGLAAGRPVVVPGRLNRAATAVYHLTPRRLLLPLLARSHPGLKKR
ncbi:SDR family oxidoreductase [Mycobacterium sp. shizuoka-1]|uniref:SDR family NAD(P)-dependent oxidoreductase n=1 Tax=Mycobacterium sp. shizuoka-1 TaxID=2039281 RepID=UPI000C065D22|nr:SDR family NAD(P)-dependent oxidoreductase [Mycobacterium sp. shizuoka-1]GAY17713.1 dehydrogenase [Mycobacterium sp. shizuoka-1]